MAFQSRIGISDIEFACGIYVSVVVVVVFHLNVLNCGSLLHVNTRKSFRATVETAVNM